MNYNTEIKKQSKKILRLLSYGNIRKARIKLELGLLKKMTCKNRLAVAGIVIRGLAKIWFSVHSSPGALCLP